MLDELEQVDAEVVASIGTTLGAAARTVPAGIAPNASGRDAIATFATLLARGDIAAIDHLAEIEEHLATLMPTDQVERLKAAINQLEFEQARIFLEQTIATASPDMPHFPAAPDTVSVAEWPWISCSEQPLGGPL